MSWDNVLRMLGLRSDATSDDRPNPELAQARDEVEQLHRKAERVLEDYAKANGLYQRK